MKKKLLFILSMLMVGTAIHAVPAKRAAAEQAAREAAAEQAARKAEAERQAAELKAKMDAERSTREIAAAGHDQP